jgi:hypothetical protein
MGLFFENRRISFLNDRIDALMTKVKDMELENEKLKSHMISLRGFVNRNKLAKEGLVQEETPAEEESPEQKVLLDPNGNKIK